MKNRTNKPWFRPLSDVPKKIQKAVILVLGKASFAITNLDKVKKIQKSKLKEITKRKDGSWYIKAKVRKHTYIIVSAPTKKVRA